jgi:hypothetical protein
MKTLKQACKPQQSIFDPSRRDTVLSLNNLIRSQIDPAEFFEENHMTQGMRLLLENGFKRLEGKSDQGVFRLTQAMGGGKTHNLLAFALLAKHPEYRPLSAPGQNAWVSLLKGQPLIKVWLNEKLEEAHHGAK